MKKLISNFETKIEDLFENFNENLRGYSWYDLNEEVSIDEEAKELYVYLANWGMVVRKSFLEKTA